MKNSDQWFVFLGNDLRGPWDQQGIQKMIEKGTLTWLQFAIAPDGECVRLFEINGMEPKIPKRPNPIQLADAFKKIQGGFSESNEEQKTAERSMVVPSSPAPPKGSGAWYLQVEGSKFGPLALKEVGLVLKSGKLPGKVFGWRDGLKKWIPVDSIAEIQNFLNLTAAGDKSPAAIKRNSIRVPLMATVRFSFYTQDQDSAVHFSGICRDISIDGILIVSEGFLVKQGDIIDLEISPADSTSLPEFRARGEVVRLVPEENGFAVLFKNLAAETKAALKRHEASFLAEQK